LPRVSDAGRLRCINLFEKGHDVTSQRSFKSVESLRSSAGLMMRTVFALSGYTVVAVILTVTNGGSSLWQLWWLMSGIIVGGFAAAAAAAGWVLGALAEANYADAVGEAFGKD